MQNIHTHAWDQNMHFEEETIKETDLSRGYKINLTVDFKKFMEDMKPFSRVLVFGLKAKLTGYWVPDQFVYDFVKKAPDKLTGFASCDPTQKNHMEELRFAIEGLKLSGVKMGPIYAGFDPRDPLCDEVYAYCVKKNIPVIFHSGTTFNRKAPLKYSRPLLFDEVAIKYPELKIVLAHLGHPYCDECLAVIRKHRNMYADLSALYYRPWQFYNALITAQEYLVSHKILFGTDYPFTTAKDSINGLLNINDIKGKSGLPEVSAAVLQDILERDSFKLLEIK